VAPARQNRNSGAPAASALENAVPAILIAVAAGGATGYIGALGLGWSLRRDWTEPSALRLGESASVVIYAILALTVVRIVPVLLALRGTTLTRLEAVFLGWMGPRGLASLVFGLLAVIQLKGGPSSLAAQVTVITVLLSVIVHGVTAGPIGAAFAKRSAAAARPSPISSPD
jgi:NhaP-type Na+/H+ or K+/H+ antiporter